MGSVGDTMEDTPMAAVEEAVVLVLGEAHRLKPPTLTKHHSNHLCELFYNSRFR